MKKILLVLLIIPFFFACKHNTPQNNQPEGPICGNGIQEEGENSLNCPADCPPESTIGNGVLEAGEECDDGNRVNGDGCSSEGKVESGYICRPGQPCYLE